MTTVDRILTTHAGSLPRPRSLTDLFIERASGKVVAEELLKQEIDVAAEHVVRMQKECGIDIINDGEVSRESFFSYVRHRMTGFAGESNRRMMSDVERYPTFMEMRAKQRAALSGINLRAAPQAQGEIQYISTDDINADCVRLVRLAEAFGYAPEMTFMTAPSPGIIAAAMDNAFYADMGAYIDALAEALSAEYKCIADAGITLQIDAPDLGLERHTYFGGRPLDEFLAFSHRVIAALNRAMAGLPREQVRLHVCYGNYNGPHELDVALDEIWPEVVQAWAGSFVISLANPRHEHEIDLFTQGLLPGDAKLVVGVIDTTTNYVEHPEVVARRIQRAVQAVGDPRRVIAATDCGFETSAGFSTIAPEIAWAKLRALSEGASIASRRIFG